MGKLQSTPSKATHTHTIKSYLKYDWGLDILLMRISSV